MALSVLTLCTRFAETLLISTLAIIMNSIARNTLRQLSAFWRLKDFSLQQILTALALLLGQTFIKGITIAKKESFVGVQEVNCNESKNCAMLAKKNTQIRRLSVLRAVCSIKLLIIVNIAYLIKRINFFRECYV